LPTGSSNLSEAVVKTTALISDPVTVASSVHTVIYSSSATSGSPAFSVVYPLPETVVESTPTHAVPPNVNCPAFPFTVTDESAIEQFVDAVIKDFPVQVQQFKDGKEIVIQFLVGQVMKQSKGKANPQAVQKILREKL